MINPKLRRWRADVDPGAPSPNLQRHAPADRSDPEAQQAAQRQHRDAHAAMEQRLCSVPTTTQL